MLVSLFRENQSAFIDNNMNRIRVGQILRVPGAEEAKVIPANRKRRKKFVRSRSILRIPAEAAGEVAAVPSRGDTAGQTASG